MKKICFPLFLMCILSVHAGYAGITGTLAGKVFEKGTNEPLPGTNIILTGTTLGAAADEKGFFLVNNIPAGKYNIRVEMIGYRTLIVEDVTILMDLRTSLQLELEETVLEMEEITVTAHSSMIQKDVTATTHFINRQEITRLPVLSFTDIVDIQPGVAAGHIRGGRESEVLYMVDGFPIQEVIEGKVGTELPMTSIIDMTVQTGGFNAEYGNAMSGVVNILTQDGGEKLEAMTEFSMQKFQSMRNPWRDRKNDADWISEMYLGGPLFTQKLKFYVAGDVRAPHTRWKREEFGQRMMIYNSKNGWNMNLNGKLTWAASNSFKIRIQGLLSLWDWQEYDHKWSKNLAVLPDRSKKSYRTSIALTHTLSPTTFYELRLSRYDVLKSIYGASSIDMAGVEYENNDPTSWVIAGDYPWWLDHQEIHNTAKFDFTSQLNNYHQLKAGLEFVYYDLYKKNVQRMEVKTYDPQFPQYISYDTEYHYYPNRGAAYVQDKIDYDGMIINVGIRYDYLDPRAQRPALEEKVYGQRHTWIINQDKKEQASLKHQFSPRVGIAIPMGPDQELHVNYGWFFQMPLFDYLYTNSNLNLAEGFSPLGDPDLKPSRTISYEVSYKNQIREKTLFDFTVFNKEVSNLVDNNTYLDKQKNSLTGTGYSRFVNLEFVNIWGTEIYLKRDVSQFLSGKVSYTYMVAKGTGSENTEKFNWITKDTKVPISEYYLSWDQRHTLVTNIDFRKPDNWGVNLLWRWNSPLPWTEYRGVATEPNNNRMHVITSLDIRLNKDFIIANYPVSLFAEFINVFDRKNLLWQDSEGREGGYLNDPGAWDERYCYRLGFNAKF
ncbi:MAG TPA: TonB-dependent receptor [bacterium]|nr:TonB-dependent receptor [bacterium]HPN45168.1 TonB-dependent receptor [bacterium]